MKFFPALLLSFVFFYDYTSDVLEEGRLLQKKGDHYTAIKVFTSEIERGSRQSELFQERARSRYLNGSSFSAIVKDINVAIGLDSKCDQCYALKAKVYSSMVDSDVDFVNLPVAEKTISKALAIRKEETGYWIQRANIRTELNDFDGAISDLNQALKLRPAFHRFLHYRALLNLERADYKATIKDYNLALKTSKDKSYFKNRGTALFKISKYDEASKDFLKTIEIIEKQIKPTNRNSPRQMNKAKQMLSDTYILLGLSKCHAKQEAMACDAFFKAEYLKNSRARLYINRYCKSY